MAFKRDEEFRYSVRGINRIIEERGSEFVALREIAWGVGNDDDIDDSTKVKLDLRKYYVDKEGNEKMSKGVSFMTEEGPHELAKILLEEGFGNTTQCLSQLARRRDFKEAIDTLNGKIIQKEEYVDLRDLIA